MELIVLLSAISLLLTGAIAGFFYAFSVCVMRGLDRIEATSAVSAMKSINAVVLNPIFFITFFLTPIAQLSSAYLASQGNNPNSSLLFVIAAVLYILGAVLPTIIVNVPMNERLARIEVTTNAERMQSIWSQYSSRWTKWNTVRTVFSLLSLLAVGAAIEL